MTTLSKISARDVAARLASGDLRLIDIREADEFAREHIVGADSLPLSTLAKGTVEVTEGVTPVFMCRSGNRTDVNCAQLADVVNGQGLLLEGGLEGWRTEGLPTYVDTGAPLEIMRQVQITAGSLVLLGVILSLLVHPAFIGVSAFVGAGLTFAGVSGWCGMAKLLGAMPWNQRAQAA